MFEDRFDDRLSESAREYNEPPETPREAMWAKIAAARETERGVPLRPLRPLRRVRPLHPLRWAAGIAAILAIGIGLGRLTVHPTSQLPPANVTSSTPSRVNQAAYHLVTTEHLSQAEAFLTLFRTSVRQGGNERLASATAQQLLATNRLLLDSPAANDASTKLLLQDLELVLAEIAQLSPAPRSRDLDLINEGLEQGGVLSRLRTAVPAGASPTRGSL
jgi:hypothetical protein